MHINMLCEQHEFVLTATDGLECPRVMEEVDDELEGTIPSGAIVGDPCLPSPALGLPLIPDDGRRRTASSNAGSETHPMKAMQTKYRLCQV